MNNFSPRVRSRKLWDKHGSWLILVLVVGFAFNGGAEWREYKHRGTVAAIVTAGVAERDALQVRLRERTDQYQELARQCGPNAKAAVDKADEAVEKVNKLIENGAIK